MGGAQRFEELRREVAIQLRLDQGVLRPKDIAGNLPPLREAGLDELTIVLDAEGVAHPTVRRLLARSQHSTPTRRSNMNRILVPVAAVALAACANHETALDRQADTGRQIVGEEVCYEAGGVTLRGYIAYDRNLDGLRPGVLVVHEW